MSCTAIRLGGKYYTSSKIQKISTNGNFPVRWICSVLFVLQYTISEENTLDTIEFALLSVSTRDSMALWITGKKTALRVGRFDGGVDLVDRLRRHNRLMCAKIPYKWWLTTGRRKTQIMIWLQRWLLQCGLGRQSILVWQTPLWEYASFIIRQRGVLPPAPQLTGRLLHLLQEIHHVSQQISQLQT